MATLIANRLSEERGKLVKTAILTMELLLLSTGFISTFFMLKKAIRPSYLFNMFFVNLSEILNYLKSFLSSPLYICLFINSVVILILTFSKFHHPTMEFLNVFLDDQKENNIADDHDDIQIQPQPYHHEIKEDDNMPKRTSSVIAMDTVMSFFSRYNLDPVVLKETAIEDEMIPCSDVVKDIEIDCVTKLSFPDVSPLTEPRQIVSPRSPNRVPDTTNYQEMVMNQEDIEEDDSMDATWKAITEGGNNKKKKKQVLKKSETWPIEPPVTSAQSIGSKDLLPSVAAVWKELRKSVTFNETLSMFRRGGLRGDISVSTEESNKRFDDFIKKINHERLLQRQESDQRAFKNNRLNRAR
ncbi:uncharacterized protein LOC129895279 [Solanum dulcamara]|uniref:uncharacterized protein LOC129895279 n=1 Tax=Solanum dulcamara TaxID=45834 RepID=UPI002485FB7B|nr:uncharacterized protein LOC129895279 [Solanum dulcamara]